MREVLFSLRDENLGAREGVEFSIYECRLSVFVFLLFKDIPLDDISIRISYLFGPQNFLVSDCKRLLRHHLHHILYMTHRVRHGNSNLFLVNFRILNDIVSE